MGTENPQTTPPPQQGDPGIQVPVDVQQDNVPVQTVTDTNNGFLVGVDDPAQSAAAVMAAQQAQSQQDSPLAQDQPQAVLTDGTNPGQKLFTEEEVGRIRQEEKDKLYNRLEELENFRKEAEAAAAAQEAAAQAEIARLEAERKAEEEAQMTETQLLARRQEEMQQSIEALRADNERKDALLAKEEQFRQMSKFRDEVLEREKEFIIPELRDLVSGTTEDEILRSVEVAKEKSSAIVASMKEAAQMQRQHTPGVSSAGAPPVGPMEQAASYETYTADQISNMDMATYAQHRDRLLRASSPNYRG